MSQRVAGKVFVVTGSTQCCGEGIALALADEGARAVTVCGRQEDKGKAVVAALEANLHDAGAQQIMKIRRRWILRRSVVKLSRIWRKLSREINGDVPIEMARDEFARQVARQACVAARSNA